MTTLTAASSFRAAATALEVKYRAGLRVSEVVRLAPSGIRWKDGILEVHRGKGAKDRNVTVDAHSAWWSDGDPELKRGLRVLWRLSDSRATRAYSAY